MALALKNDKNYLTFFLPVLAGPLYSLGFPSPLPFLTSLGPILAITLLLYSCRTHSPTCHKHSFRQGLQAVLLFCLSFNFCSFYWIPYTLKEFGNIFFPFNFILGIFFTLITAPQYFIFFFLFIFWKKAQESSSPRLRKWTKIIKEDLTLYHLFLALTLTLCEQFTPQQFPAHLGHSWLSVAPYLGLAPLFGAPAFSFISFWLALTASSWWQIKKIDYISIIFAFIFVLFNFLFPLKYLQTGPEVKNNYIRVVQANIGNYLKVNSERGDLNSVSKILELYKNLSVEDIVKPIDLIIWPETAYPHSLASSLMFKDSSIVPEVFREINQESGAEILFGGYDQDLQNLTNQSHFETYYNAAFFIDHRGLFQEVYRKMKLIPFGETLPFGPLNKYIGKVISHLSFFSSGKKYTLFNTKNKTIFMVAICYEILFVSTVRDLLNRPQQNPHFLINLTNDSWYGDSAEPYQHKFLAHWRALEFNIPIIRSTNTGITSILYPDGKESQQLGIFQKGRLEIELLTPPRQKTLYQKWGLLTSLPLWLLFLGTTLFLRRFKVFRC